MRKISLILSIFFLLISFQNVSAQKKSTKKKKAKPTIISCGVCNQKAIYLPKPEYPKAARSVRASGNVVVLVTIDEKGNVETAKAITGHILFRATSEKAALKAKFEPFTLSGKPVKAVGNIVYKLNEDFQYFCSDCPVGKIISAPKPVYPRRARKAKITGEVTVQVLVNEQGDVVSAKVLSGHRLLRKAAENAAYKAKFTPARMGENPIKFRAIIRYNFQP
ncbi:MAG TPA: energy transducer TonB [Pyrinomonadaceae bacterium]|nr:energy transducer TonB [Pyrinomonadaceae bacterium]